jgi:hypothetical protein
MPLTKTVVSQTFEQTRSDVHLIKNEITSMKLKMDILHNALVGSELSADGGLIKRIVEAEKEVVDLERRVLSLEKKENNNSLYVKLIWGLVSAGFATVATLIISHFLK